MKQSWGKEKLSKPCHISHSEKKDTHVIVKRRLSGGPFFMEKNTNRQENIFFFSFFLGKTFFLSTLRADNQDEFLTHEEEKLGGASKLIRSINSLYQGKKSQSRSNNYSLERAENANSRGVNNLLSILRGLFLGFKREIFQEKIHSTPLEGKKTSFMIEKERNSRLSPVGGNRSA